MKKIFFSIVALSAMAITACNNNSSKNETEKIDVSTIGKDSTQHATVADDKDVKTVAITYSNVDGKISASLKEIVDHYLHIKNALANDNSSEAADGAKAMEATIKKLDKSLFTAEQKTTYDKDEEELKEHAEHIAKNGDKLEHQRTHFSMMSEVMYDLVKAYGSGRILYHDHCPMYNNNTGAIWLSETKEIRNPYYGDKMMTCGSVMEMFK